MNRKLHPCNRITSSRSPENSSFVSFHVNPPLKSLLLFRDEGQTSFVVDGDEKRARGRAGGKRERSRKSKGIMKYRSIARTFNPLTRVGGINRSYFLGISFPSGARSGIGSGAIGVKHMRARALARHGASRVCSYALQVFKKPTLTVAGRPDCENLRRPLILIYDKRERNLVRGRSRYNWIVTQDARPALPARAAAAATAAPTEISSFLARRRKYLPMRGTAIT